MPIPGGILEEARLSRGRGQEEIAALIGRTQGYISKLEKGNGSLKGDELLKIARFLEYDPYVFTGEIALKEGTLKGKEQNKTLIDLYKELENIKKTIQQKVPDIVPFDELYEQLNKRDIRHLVQIIQNWTTERIQRVIAFSQGMESQEDLSEGGQQNHKEA